MSQPVDPAFCPLCGQPNACVLATDPGAAQVECWCACRRFDAPLLARALAASAGRACICSRCQRAGARVPDPG